MASHSVPKTVIDALAALENLRAPIVAYPCQGPAETRLKSSMLQLAEQLEGIYEEDDDDTLDAAIVWTALYSFPALVTPGPTPQDLVSLVIQGKLTNEETLATLQTLRKIRHVLGVYQPTGFSAALWRSTLLAIYSMIELFIVLDDERGINLCFELLDTAESIVGTMERAGKRQADHAAEDQIEAGHNQDLRYKAA